MVIVWGVGRLGRHYVYGSEDNGLRGVFCPLLSQKIRQPPRSHSSQQAQQGPSLPPPPIPRAPPPSPRCPGSPTSLASPSLPPGLNRRGPPQPPRGNPLCPPSHTSLAQVLAMQLLDLPTAGLVARHGVVSNFFRSVGDVRFHKSFRGEPMEVGNHRNYTFKHSPVADLNVVGEDIGGFWS